MYCRRTTTPLVPQWCTKHLMGTCLNYVKNINNHCVRARSTEFIIYQLISKICIVQCFSFWRFPVSFHLMGPDTIYFLLQKSRFYVSSHGPNITTCALPATSTEFWSVHDKRVCPVKNYNYSVFHTKDPVYDLPALGHRFQFNRYKLYRTTFKLESQIIFLLQSV